MEVKTILSSRKPKASLKGNETLNITIIAQTQQLDTRLPVLPLATFDGTYSHKILSWDLWLRASWIWTTVAKIQQTSKNQNLKDEYFKTIRDYINSGHLIKCVESFQNNQYFLPHHAVTKSYIQVVYDASCSTSNGTSLNSHLLTEHPLQNDIRIIYFVIGEDILLP